MAKTKRNRIQPGEMVILGTSMWGLQYGAIGLVHAISRDGETATVIVNDLLYTLPTSHLEKK